jgi:hypothetical protein
MYIIRCGKVSVYEALTFVRLLYLKKSLCGGSFRMVVLLFVWVKQHRKGPVPLSDFMLRCRGWEIENSARY